MEKFLENLEAVSHMALYQLMTSSISAVETTLPSVLDCKCSGTDNESRYMALSRIYGINEFQVPLHHVKVCCYESWLN